MKETGNKKKRLPTDEQVRDTEKVGLAAGSFLAPVAQLQLTLGTLYLTLRSLPYPSSPASASASASMRVWISKVHHRKVKH